jgi:acetyl esterase/lipase
MPHHPSRRALLAGGIGALAAGVAGGYRLVEDGTLPGKYQLARILGACGSPPPPPRGSLPARQETVFWSAYRKRTVHMVTLLPAGQPARGLGLVVGLHGFGADASSLADQVAPAMTTARISTCAVVTIDGGNTYWHRRADGDDPLGMIIHEVLPRAHAAGLVTDRIAITGESMGGYGALLLAERLARPTAAATADLRSGRTPTAAAVAAISPAIFASYQAARAADPHAFDDPADFAANNVQAGVAALRNVPTWICCGGDDPFQPQDALLRAHVQRLTGHEPAGGVLPGCHDNAFFERNLPAALTFAAGYLGLVKTEEGR